MNYPMKYSLKNKLYPTKPLIVSIILLMFANLVSANINGVANFDGKKDYSPYPQPDSGYVSDHAGLLSPEQEERIEIWLWQVESVSDVEIIVVTLESIRDYPGTLNGSIESFAKALFNHYGIGNLPANNGVLLLVAAEDRQARIELGAAYGHTRNTDATRIMEGVIIPQFKQGDYVAGITDGTEAIIEEFAEMRVGFPWTIVGFGAAALASLFIGVSLIRQGKKGWGYVFIGLAFLLILLVIYLSVRCIQHLPQGHSSGWSAGGSGGFGGGFSGGGGATGGW